MKQRKRIKEKSVLTLYQSIDASLGSGCSVSQKMLTRCPLNRWPVINGAFFGAGNENQFFLTSYDLIIHRLANSVKLIKVTHGVSWCESAVDH